MNTITTIITFLLIVTWQGIPTSQLHRIVDPIPSGTQAKALAVARKLIRALNEGDLESMRNALAHDAIFDLAGRIYSGRQEIIGSFFVPEVIGAGGKYTELDVSHDLRQPHSITVHYEFATPDYSEKFVYDYTIIDARIQKVVARYS